MCTGCLLQDMICLINPTQFGEKTFLIQCSEAIQLLHSRYKSLWGWWVHEIESKKVVYPHSFQSQSSHAKINPLNFWSRSRGHLVIICEICVKWVTFPWSSPVHPAQLALCFADAWDIGVTTSDSCPSFRLYTFCLPKPGSMT